MATSQSNERSNTHKQRSKTQTHTATPYSPLRIAINGFGRIGRNVLRVMLERGLLREGHIQLVAINDIADADALQHLLKYDSTHGRLQSSHTTGYQVQLQYVENKPCLHIHPLAPQPLAPQPIESPQHPNNYWEIQLFHKTNPTELPWSDLQIDVVLECSGHFRSYAEANKHRQAGAKQVIIGAAPFDDVDACIVMGVNDEQLHRQLPIISSVSCTTQALVPLIATLDTSFGVQSAMMTEIHAVTADQNVLDQAHRDFRRARAAGHNIIPTTSSSIAATERVLPQMVGKINGHSIRVPTINVAAIDVTFIFNNKVTIDSLYQCLHTASQKSLSGVMGFSEEPLVSSDFIHSPESLIIDGLQLMQVGNQFKVFAWYDNEWGYANRLVDMCVKLSSA